MKETKKDKIIVARLWARYDGCVPTRAPIILGVDPEKYRTICVFLKKSSDKPNYLEEMGYKTFYISDKKFFRIINVAVICKLARILKDEKVDILHCHRHQATIYGTIAAKLAGVPVVFGHVHGLNRSKAPRRRFINSLVLKRVNKILTVGQAVQNDVLRNNPVVRPDQVVSLGNSIDFDQFANVQISKKKAKKNLGLDVNSFIFGTVGRQVPTKGLSHLIKAFTLVKQYLPSGHLLFVGDGRNRAVLERQATQTNYSGSIHFLGKRSDVPNILKAIDVFVLPSIAEGLPRALLEAMAAGVPCIGTNIGGIPEILGCNKYGYLVPPKDESALANAMIKLWKMSEEEKAKLAKQAKHRIRGCYTHEIVIEKLQNIYDETFAASQCGNYHTKSAALAKEAAESVPCVKE